MIAAIAPLAHLKISRYQIDGTLCLTGEEAHVNTLNGGLGDNLRGILQVLLLILMKKK